jgi:hypothetical protein
VNETARLKQLWKDTDAFQTGAANEGLEFHFNGLEVFLVPNLAMDCKKIAAESTQSGIATAPSQA